MSQFDKDLKIGDIVTAYKAGYWRVTEVQQRFLSESDLKFQCYENSKAGDEFNSLIYLELVADSKFNLVKNKPRVCSCDSYYCIKIDKSYFENLLKETEHKISKLTEIING